MNHALRHSFRECVLSVLIQRPEKLFSGRASYRQPLETADRLFFCHCGALIRAGIGITGLHQGIDEIAAAIGDDFRPAL